MERDTVVLDKRYEDAYLNSLPADKRRYAEAELRAYPYRSLWERETPIVQEARRFAEDQAASELAAKIACDCEGF